jgi:hypothetical protein
MVEEDPVQGFLPDGLWIRTSKRMSNMDRMPYNNDPGVEFPNANTKHFMDLEHDIQQQVFDAFNIADETVEEAVRNSQAPLEYNDKVVSVQELEELYKQASVSVWRAVETVSSMSLISVVVVIMTMCTTHDVSNAFADELFKFLSSSLLPKQNSLPNSFYHAKNTVRKMGLEYSVTHCCPSGHIFFRGVYEDMDQCPHPGCGLSRWMPSSQTVSAKVMCHFSLIPRLKRLYKSPAIAKILKWASENKIGTAEMKSVADSPAWNHIDTDIDREFTRERRNLRIGLSLDGVNPFSKQRSNHSTWPVMVVLYNLPPWLLTKKFFVLLSIHIPRKESPTSDNIDIFLAPLIEELQTLWEGVDAFDASVDIRV